MKDLINEKSDRLYAREIDLWGLILSKAQGEHLSDLKTLIVELEDIGTRIAALNGLLIEL